MNRKKKYVIIAVCLALVLLLGTSFAFFTFTKTGGSNVLTAGGFNIDFVEGQELSLNMENTFPTASYNIRKTDDNVLSFHITGENTTDAIIYYSIVVNNGTDSNDQTKSRFNAKDLRFDLIRVENNEDIYVARNKSFQALNDSVLYRRSLSKDDGTINEEYKIRVWLSSDVVISDTASGDNVYTTSDFPNRYANIKVALKATDDRNDNTKKRNYFNSFPSIITDKRDDIIEVYFDNLTSELETSYNNATIKQTVTYQNQGSVKVWLTEIADYDYGDLDLEEATPKYVLHVASNGTTYLTNCEFLFQYYYNVEKIEFNNVNTSLATSMRGMFKECLNLNSLDLSSFDTKNVTNMGSMFFKCENITAINLTSFDTSKVTDMSQMFMNCKELANIVIDNFSTSNVTTMENMFRLANSIESLDLSMLDVRKVTTTSGMFLGSSDSLLESINFDGWETTSLQDTSIMFQWSKKLTSLDLSTFSTAALENFAGMFQGCTKLVTIYVSDLWDISSVTVSGEDKMFEYDTKLVGGRGTSFSSSNITSDYARIDNPSTEPGYFTYKEIL